MAKYIIIGSGRMGGKRAKQLLKMGQSVVATTGKTLTRARELASQIPQCTAVELDQLEKIEADAAVICSPVASHGDLVLQCLHRGWHTFAEYPLAHKKDDLARIADIATTKTLQVATGFDHLEAFRPLQEAQQDLGPILSASMDGFFGTSSREKWFWDPKESLHPWWLWGIDQVAALSWLHGPVRRVQVQSTAIYGKHALEETQHAMLAFKNGGVGIVATAIHAPRYHMDYRGVHQGGSIDFRHAPGGAPCLKYVAREKEAIEVPIPRKGKSTDLASWIDSIQTGTNTLMSLHEQLHWHAIILACLQAENGDAVDVADIVSS